jgi:hypothetical protein
LSYYGTKIDENIKRRAVLDAAIRLNPRLSVEKFHKKTTNSLRITNSRKQMYFPHKIENGLNFKAPYDTPSNKEELVKPAHLKKQDSMREAPTNQWFNHNIF